MRTDKYALNGQKAPVLGFSHKSIINQPISPYTSLAQANPKTDEPDCFVESSLPHGLLLTDNQACP